jgi:hypothetical protein
MIAPGRYLLRVAAAAWLLALFAWADPRAQQRPPVSPQAHASDLFQTSDNCLACHNGLTTPGGEDVSIGSSWRASMMANSARDPYWQAGVRRETIDHPSAAAVIEDECSICHMPMTTFTARANGHEGEIFRHLPVVQKTGPEDRTAHDGVSCTICHQITDRGLGTPESFTGGYVVSTEPSEGRPVYGPFEIDKGRTTIMRSGTGLFEPKQGMHLGTSELCATCHTLITRALGPQGEPVGRLAEQVPYLEWRHSEYKEDWSCQRCHMPEVEEETRIASVLGEPREGLSRHVFLGGNFFMLGMLNRYRDELGVDALPQELDASIQRTMRHLQSETAVVSVERAEISGPRLEVDVSVRNLSGHKLPTAYPSRRAWLHLTVRDGAGRPVFESGAIDRDGSIRGNDNDADPLRFEPHYTEISRGDEVAIYETVMLDAGGVVTTGLLRGVRYVKDNRLLPRGFDKVTAGPDIAVLGAARQDADFVGGGDRIRYAIDLAGAAGPFEVGVELYFQPISYRWASNLRAYDAPETKRFVTYYDSMSSASAAVLARARATAR